MKKITLWLTTVLFLAETLVFAQLPEKVKDINKILEPTVAFSHNMWVVGDNVFFTNNEGYLGIYDGFTYSTLELSSVTEIVALNGVNYISADDGANGKELFKYDGSTITLIDINPSGNSNPMFLTVVGNSLFFSAENGTNGRELWKYDGTSTSQIEIRAGTTGASPEYLVAYGSELLFFADDGVNGKELWKYNGTSTSLIQDIRSGAIGSHGSGSPYFEQHAGKIYFAANDGTGIELYEYDGTGLTKFDVNGTSGGTSPKYLTSFNSKLYFTASTSVVGNELFQFDGTSTSVVQDLFAGSSSSSPSPKTKDSKFKVVNGNMYFQANDGINNYELYKYNGNTLTRIDVNPNTGDLSGNGFIDFIGSMGTAIYFQGYGGSSFGSELWKYDGTDLTQIEIRSGSDGSAVRHMTEFNGNLFFTAYYGDGTNEWHLWKYNGTSPVVVNLSDKTAYSDPYYFTKVGERIYFSADDGVHGSELWYTDGFTTEMVADLYAGRDGSNPTNLVEYKEKLVFFAQDEESTKMFVYDGASFETFDLEGSNEPAIIYNGDLYFGADGGVNGTELYRFDGSSVFLVQDINPTGSSYPSQFIEWNSALYFAAEEATNGRELWKFDGTTATLAADVYDIGGSSPARLTIFGGHLYFTAYTPQTGNELVKFDGTDFNILDIYPGIQSADLSGFTEYMGKMYFSANDGVNGNELFYYDGAEWGVVDVNPNGDAYPGGFFVFKNVLYFSAFNPTYGREMWKYDGVNLQVTDIYPGPNNSYASDFFRHGPFMYFNANNGSGENGLFRYDHEGIHEFLGSEMFYYQDETAPIIYLNGYAYFQGEIQSDYEVWRLRAISEENDILSFSLAEQGAPAVIDPVNHTIGIELNFGSNVTSLSPTISVSEFAQISPIGAQNFSAPFVYTVTSEYGADQEWTVNVTVSEVLSTSLSQEINIYPNPTKDILFIDYQDLIAVKLYDLNGRIIHEFNGIVRQINLTGLNEGMYLVNITTKQKSVSHKILKTN